MPPGALADSVRERPYVEWQRFSDASWVEGFHNYWKAQYLDRFDAGVLAGFATRITSPLSDIKLWQLDRPTADTGAFGHRGARLLLNINTRWADGDPAPHIAWTRALWEALLPYSSGGVYVNFLGDEGADRVRAAYGEANYARLVALKRRYDPENVFRVNQNISLGGDEPPPRGLAAAGDSTSAPFGTSAATASPSQRRAVALDHGQQLGLAAELAEHDLERLARLAPGDELLVDEADRVAAAEAALGVVARGLGDAAGADVGERLLHRGGVAARVRGRVERDGGGEAGLPSSASATTRTTFSESSAARSAAMRTFGEFGSTTTSSAGTLVDAGQQLVGRRVERRRRRRARAAPEALEELGACRRRRRRRARRSVWIASRERAPCAADLLVHVGDVEAARPSPTPSNSAVARSGLVGVDVDLERRARSPTTSTRVAEPLEARDPRRRRPGPRR